MKFDNESRDATSFWELAAKAISLLGIMGIAAMIALLAQDGNAADGFQPGNRAFNNPYAPPPPAGGTQDFFEEGEEPDDIIFPEDNFPPPDSFANSDPSSAPPAPQQSPSRPSQGGPRGGGSGLQVGGGSPGGVISGNTIKPLKVDTESAEGCKEVITDFNFPDADILDIAKTLGRLLGKNFIYDKDVKGRISIVSNAPVTCGDAWKAFLTALDVNNFALIPSGSYIRIARQRDARDKQLKTYTGEYAPDTDALITRLYPLKYLDADEVARNFRSFMPPNSRIIPYDQTNTLIITDTAANIQKLTKLLEVLDVEGYDTGIEVISVKHASATEIAKLIDSLIPGSGPTPGGPPGAPRFGASRFTARRTKEGGVIQNIISDERTNTLIVHANGKGTEQVRTLVAKLDQKLPATTGGGKVHVIYLQFADAEQIAATLNALTQQAAQRSAAPAAPGGTGANPVQAALFEGSIRVSPDKSTNSLVVTASGADFVTIQRVINRLDIPRDQVYAEVVIMEVSLGKDFQFSTNFVNPSNGISLQPGEDLLAFAAAPFQQKGAIINFATGGTTNIKVGGNDVQVSNVHALIKAIQTNSNANILATPQILTLDNVEAEFETAERIPVATQVAVPNAGISTSVSKENVSLSIKIKPQINKMSNFVKLEITAKLEDIVKRDLPQAVRDQAFATVQRNAKTTVVVADSDTVVLGGLSRDNTQDSTSKIPILGDIPLLGWLFRSTQQVSSKTNLLIFITPQIIRQYENVRAVLDKKLRERDEFLERSTGGEDPMRRQRDEMIRGLPDLDKIIKNRPKTSYTLEDEPAGHLEGLPPARPVQQSPTLPQAPQVPPPQSGDLGSPAAPFEAPIIDAVNPEG